MTAISRSKKKFLAGATALLTMTMLLVLATQNATAGVTSLLINFESNSTVATSSGDANDFGGNVSSMEAAPGGGLSVKLVKTAGAETWAGTTFITLPNGSFLASNQLTATVKIYAPAAGKVIKIKVEDKNNGAVSVETDATTSAAGWNTLTFDFSKNSGSTPAFDTNKTYNKASIFEDFGNKGAGDIYYLDEITIPVSNYTAVSSGSSGSTSANPLTFPINVTFEANDSSGYKVGHPDGQDDNDFAGAGSSVADDPSGVANKVGKIQRGTTSGPTQIYAGTILLDLPKGATLISASGTTATLRVYSPKVGMDVKLKLQDSKAQSAKFVEADVKSTIANAWETMTFDFSKPTTGKIESGVKYPTLVLFLDFGVVGRGEIFFVDDLSFPSSSAGAATPSKTPTPSPSPSKSATPSPTATPSATPSSTPSSTPSPTPTPTPTATPSPTATESETPQPVETPVALAFVSSPKITGSAKVGSKLTVTLGQISVASGYKVSYQWLVCKAKGGATLSLPTNCAVISKATGTTFTATAKQKGLYVRAQVKLVRGSESVVGYSATSGKVA